MTAFKKGDRVEILPNSINWDAWVDKMDAWVGTVGIVIGDTVNQSRGIKYIRVSNLSNTDDWNFPLKSLRNLEFHSGEYYNETPQPNITITEPLQSWERF